MPTDLKNVNEITQQVIDIVQANSELQNVWVRGKISNIRHIRNGTLIFTLADENKKIECVISDDGTTLREKLPTVGNSVSIKGHISIKRTISQYKFAVTEINLLGTTLLAQPISVSDLIVILKETLRVHTGSVQGIIAKVFRTPTNYTILTLKDINADGQSDDIIECVFPQGINPRFPLQRGERVQVIGKFGTFSRTGAYRIEIDKANKITQVTKPPGPGKTTRNQCEECHQYFSKLQDQLCHICYNARLSSEGIVVGAVMRYFDAPKFANFSTKREYEIRFGSGGNIIGRADIALLNNEGNPVAIVECKRIGYDGNDGIVQLEGYINPTVAKLGLFADNTDPYEWTFLKRNDERTRYDTISRSQFEIELGVEQTPEIPPDKTRLEIVRGNIIEAETDAIVTTAISQLTRVTGIDGEIREVGGEEVDRECQEIIELKGFRPQGDVEISTGGNLTAKHIIHVVGPINEAETLAHCYKKSLQLASEKGIRSIAFTPVSTGGNFRYPIEQATPIALNAVKEFVEQAHQNNEMVPERIQFVLFD